MGMHIDMAVEPVVRGNAGDVKMVTKRCPLFIDFLLIVMGGITLLILLNKWIINLWAFVKEKST